MIYIYTFLCTTAVFAILWGIFVVMWLITRDTDEAIILLIIFLLLWGGLSLIAVF